jgi:hypothetical protein
VEGRGIMTHRRINPCVYGTRRTAKGGAPNWEKAMYMVYWTAVNNGVKTPHQKEFNSGDMTSALKFMEDLRTQQRAGEGIRFVTMSSENPNSVGHPGVADPDPSYAWKKRRQ